MTQIDKGMRDIVENTARNTADIGNIKTDVAEIKKDLKEMKEWALIYVTREEYKSGHKRHRDEINDHENRIKILENTNEVESNSFATKVKEAISEKIIAWIAAGIVVLLVGVIGFNIYKNINDTMKSILEQTKIMEEKTNGTN